MPCVPTSTVWNGSWRRRFKSGGLHMRLKRRVTWLSRASWPRHESRQDIVAWGKDLQLRALFSIEGEIVGAWIALRKSLKLRLYFFQARSLAHPQESATVQACKDEILHHKRNCWLAS